MELLVRPIGSGAFLECFVVCTVVFFLFAIAMALLAVCLRVHNNRKRRLLYRLEEIWRPALLKILTGDGSEQELWDSVPPRRASDFIDLLLRFARRLRGDELITLTRVARPYLELVAVKLERGSVGRRALAVETLGRLGRGKFDHLLTRALDDSDAAVALLAARWLMRNEGPSYLETVLARIHRFDRWKPTLLASMLASVGSEAASPLRRMLTDEEQPVNVRKLAAEALTQLNDFAAADCALDILDREDDRELTAAALRLLGRVGRPDQVAPVRRLVRSSDEAIRANAVTTLAMLGHASDEGLLRDAIDDPSAWVAMRAADGLRSAGHAAFLRELASSGHARAEMARQVLSEVL